MALSVCKANLLSPPLSLSSSSSFSSSPSAAVGAASNRRSTVVSFSNLRSLPTRICCAASPASLEEPQRDGRPRFKDFPYASAPVRDLMLEVLSMVETRLGTELVPHTLPPDVEYYKNESGNNQGSLYVLAGAPSSRVDFILGSWQHWETPEEGATDEIRLTCFMSVSTDAPSFTMEFVQCSPTRVLFTLDLPQRRDLVLCHDYLRTFYINTRLDELRDLILCTAPGVFVCVPSCVPERRIFSPTAILVCVDTSKSDDGGEKRLEEILREEVRVAAKKAVETWLEVCACGKGRNVTREDVRHVVEVRNLLLQSKIIESDIGCSMVELYGKENAYRVQKELWRFVTLRG